MSIRGRSLYHRGRLAEDKKRNIHGDYAVGPMDRLCAGIVPALARLFPLGGDDFDGTVAGHRALISRGIQFRAGGDTDAAGHCPRTVSPLEPELGRGFNACRSAAAR